MENMSGEKSLVDEINLNWNSLPIKYDNFMEMYAAKEDEQSEQEIINKVIIYFTIGPVYTLKVNISRQRELQNAFKHALTFKQAPLDNKSSPKKVISEALKAQDIPKETINNATKELTEKEKLIGMLDEAISALEFVIAHVSRPVNEQNSEKQTLLHLVKKDFMKQQKYLMTAVQNYFPKNEKEAHLVLNVRNFY